MVFRNKNAIICDMDGTLIDSIPLWNDVDRKLVEYYGKVPHERIGEERSKFLSENTSGDIYVKYGQYLIDTYELEGLDAEKVSSLRSDMSKQYHEEEMDYKEGADEFLRKAKEKGFKLILASSTSKWVIDAYTTKNKKMMSKANMLDIFDIILTREDVSLKKPNPEIYKVATKLSGFDKCRVIAIEDELVGVKAAVDAGIDVISMYDKHADIDRDYINALSTYSFKDFPTLTKRL